MAILSDKHHDYTSPVGNPAVYLHDTDGPTHTPHDGLSAPQEILLEDLRLHRDVTHKTKMDENFEASACILHDQEVTLGMALATLRARRVEAG